MRAAPTPTPPQEPEASDAAETAAFLYWTDAICGPPVCPSRGTREAVPDGDEAFCVSQGHQASMVQLGRMLQDGA